MNAWQYAASVLGSVIYLSFPDLGVCPMNEQEAPVIPAYFSMVSPVPCADCRQPVRLEIQQEYTKDRFGRVLCLDCEEKAIEKAASQLRECCNSCILYKNNICYGCTLSSPLPSYCEEGGRES